ncbi:MAG: hypothetical protein EU532_14215 [Promethearchaeota archaeon]|nr:MAG: hypothetical protein EU532_14215 [Candidatus Lokiarchaeota archaeon]
MTDLSKNMKILFIVDAIICSIYAIFYLIIPETFLQIVEYAYFDPVYWRHFGATALVIGLFCVIAVRRAKWEEVKVILEIGIVWVISILGIAIWEYFFIPATVIGKINTLFVIILLIVVICINIYLYIQEVNRKS